MNLLNKSSRAEVLIAIGKPEVTSSAMIAALNEWYGLYFDKQATPDEDPCQQIPYAIVNKLTKTAFGEFSTQAKSGDEYCGDVINKLSAVRKRAVQQALIGGLSGVKPYPTSDGIKLSVIRRDCMLILGINGDGVPTDIVLVESTVSGRDCFTLLERRQLDAVGRLIITNTLYRSDASQRLGRKVPLSSLARYESLAEEVILPAELDGLGIAWVRVPTENDVDGSLEPVSIYSPAVPLIHRINRNEAELNSEFRNGKSRVFASADLLRQHADGTRDLDDSLFVSLDGDPEDTGLTIFSPELREESYHARKREYLRNVESVIGLKRGLLSEVEAADRTATEITSSDGDYALSIGDIQEMWTDAVKEAVRICGVLGQVYRIPGAHPTSDEEIIFDFGNGVLYDKEQIWQQYLDLVARGMLKPEIALGWRFGLPTETEKDLEEIRKRFMPEMTELFGAR